MIGKLIKHLQEAKNDCITVLNLLHHLKAMLDDEYDLDLIYIAKIVDEIIAKVDS